MSATYVPIFTKPPLFGTIIPVLTPNRWSTHTHTQCNNNEVEKVRTAAKRAAEVFHRTEEILVQIDNMWQLYEAQHEEFLPAIA